MYFRGESNNNKVLCKFGDKVIEWRILTVLVGALRSRSISSRLSANWITAATRLLLEEWWWWFC